MPGRFDMQDFLGLPDREYRLLRAKWAVIHNINAMLEDGKFDVGDLAHAVDMDEKHLDSWLRGIVRDVSLDSLAALYDVAAEKSGWPTLETLIWGPAEDGE